MLAIDRAPAFPAQPKGDDMRKFLLLAAIMLALPAVGMAQDAPRAEIFGGYSYLRADDDNRGEDLHGWNASLATNLNKWFGLALDFSGHYGDPRVLPGAKADVNAHIFTVGPRFSYRGNERVTPFAHILFGAARSHVAFDSPTVRFRESDSAFAMVVGGGVDIKLGQYAAYRLFQADYVLTRFSEENQHNFRVSTGIVFRIGEQ